MSGRTRWKEALLANKMRKEGRTTSKMKGHSIYLIDLHCY
jgi:hypothetical protein